MKIKRLLIILCCCVITLFSLVFVGCKRDTAKASIYSRSVLVELPGFYFHDTNYDCYFPSMYFGRDDYLNHYYIYYMFTDNLQTPYYEKCINGDNQVYFCYFYPFVGNDNVMSNRIAVLSNNNTGSQVRVYTDYNYDTIISNTTHINLTYSGTNLTYLLLDNNDSQVARILITNLDTTDNIVVNSNYTSMLLSTNILYDQEILLENAYNTGYNEAYNNAYNIGFTNGYNSGVTDGFSATTPFDILVDSIERFLNIELFGFFKISSLFYISFGLIMLGIVIKVFLGG